MIHGWTWASVALVAALVAHARAETPKLAAERLTWRWAPIYVQHVAEDDEGRDRPTRVDFDGNWDATDNWDAQRRFGTRLPPAAYGAAILTESHAYLTYSLYYPRDWASVCLSFICHDNDLETVQLVVERDAHEGRLVEIRTKAHHTITDTDARDVARGPGGRPVVSVEAHGHGIAVCRPGDRACEARPGRIVYEPATRASSSPPVVAVGQRVGYELLSLYDSLWTRRHATFGRLWAEGETGPLSYVGARLGRLGHVMGAAMAGSRYLGGVRPPWALAGAFGKRGDWFLDPAGKDARAPARYAYNPFLDDLAAECRGARCTPARPERTRTAYLFKLGAPYLGLTVTSALVGLLLRRHAGALRF